MTDNMITKAGWLNIYLSRGNKSVGHAGGIYATEEEANHVAKEHRVACIPIEWSIPMTIPRKHLVGKRRPHTFVQALGHGLFYAYWRNHGAADDFMSANAAQAWINKCERSGKFMPS